MSLFVTIASLLHVFNISPASGTGGVGIEVRMTDGAISNVCLRGLVGSDTCADEMTCRHPGPFECTIKPRSEARAALVRDTRTTADI